jgi:hypothetical protein
MFLRVNLLFSAWQGLLVLKLDYTEDFVRVVSASEHEVDRSKMFWGIQYLLII